MGVLDKARANQEAIREQAATSEPPAADVSAIWQQIQRNNEMNQKLIGELGRAGNQKVIEAENAQLRKVLANVEQNFENYGKMLMSGMEEMKRQQSQFEQNHLKKYQELLDSNAIVESAMKQEAQRLLGYAQKTVDDIGGKVQTGTDQALSNLKNNLEKVTNQQKETVSLARQAYIWHGYSAAAIWAWRWLVLVTMMYICQRAFNVEGLGSWFKIFTGIALF